MLGETNQSLFSIGKRLELVLVVIDGQAGRATRVLVSGVECGVHEGEIRDKRGTGAIAGLCRPNVLLLDTLECRVSVRNTVADCQLISHHGFKFRKQHPTYRSR